jgi:hypothetical protein
MLSLIIVVVVLALAALYQLSGGHHVPRGQPLLGELTSDSLDSLKADFNGSAGGIRIVLLLSPT